MAVGKSRVFLLSPANSGGVRAQLLLSPRAKFDLALAVQREGAPLGEVYSFVSGLYFRGKIAYVRAFAKPPQDMPGAFIICPGRGLVPPETIVTIDDLKQIASVPVELSDARYREPFERHAGQLADIVGAECEVVLLGSIATAKYYDPLLKAFGDRLLVPAEFAGRGDMSRGGLMLRCAASGIEMNYVPAKSAARHGARPARLPRLRPGTQWKP